MRGARIDRLETKVNNLSEMVNEQMREDITKVRTTLKFMVGILTAIGAGVLTLIVHTVAKMIEHN